jgi:hypothetical protein
MLRSRVMQVHNRAGQAFRQAAQSCARSQSLFGAFFRAIRGKRGAETAIVATAHKIARVVYHRLKYREACTPESSQALDQKRRQRELNNLQRRAQALGYKLEPALVSLFSEKGFLSMPGLGSAFRRWPIRLIASQNRC